MTSAARIAIGIRTGIGLGIATTNKEETGMTLVIVPGIVNMTAIATTATAIGLGSGADDFRLRTRADSTATIRAGNSTGPQTMRIKSQAWRSACGICMPITVSRTMFLLVRLLLRAGVN